MRATKLHAYNDIDVDVIGHGSFVTVKETKREFGLENAIKRMYLTCSIDVRSFSCVCIPAEHLCLCAGVCMYPKSHEDCFPCVHES